MNKHIERETDPNSGSTHKGEPQEKNIPNDPKETLGDDNDLQKLAEEAEESKDEGKQNIKGAIKTLEELLD